MPVCEGANKQPDAGALRRSVASSPRRAQCILSVDVEDWFHILDVPSAPPRERWAALPSRVEASFRRMLDLFAAADARVTCFFLGWVAERFPQLVREAAAAGHEIASHGYGHELVYRMTPEAFSADVVRAREVLEEAGERPVLGYRSPGFSCTEDVPWFFERLADAGYRYDSSVFPAPRGHGGMVIDRLGPHQVAADGTSIVEVPITAAETMGRRICLFGGGYLRLFPYPLISRMTRRVLADQRPVVFYVHPREIDPDHPRLPMSLTRRFKSYVNLRTTEPKLRAILRDFPVTTFEDYLKTTGMLP